MFDRFRTAPNFAPIFQDGDFIFWPEQYPANR